MASLASVDRLNILYYGEMELPAAEKKLRIVMAGAFQDAVRKYYDTVRAIISDEKTDNRRKDILLAAAVVSLRKAYLGFFDKYYERYVSVIFQGGELYYGVGAWRNQHALDFAVWLTRTARDEPNIAFENSHSMTVTRTEINAMCNLAALDGAYRSGMRFKTWETFGDGKVRPSHKAVGGTRIPIDEPFTVGNSKLMFPNDTSLGADAEEIINCRCTLKFDRGTPLTNANNRGIMRVGSGRVEQAKTRDKKIEITDIAISKAAPPLIPGFSDEQNARFKELHQELLRMAKELNDSNEVAFLFDPKAMAYEKAFGGLRNVDIFENPIARDMYRNSSVGELYLLHNHPSTKSFSYSDLGVLLLNENLGGITVVTNLGYTEVLKKTENYNFSIAFDSLKRIRLEYGHTALTEEQDAEIVKRFIKAGNKFGITLLSRR